MQKMNLGGSESTLNLKDIQKGMWINIVDPSPEDIKEISLACGVSDYYFNDALDPNEISRLEHDKKTAEVFIVSNFPLVTKTKNTHRVFSTLPLGLVLTNDYILTISKSETSFLNDACLKRWEIFEQDNARFACMVITEIADLYLRYLRELDNSRINIEDKLDKAVKNVDLHDLMAMGQNLAYFSTALRSNKAVVEKMKRADILGDDKEVNICLDDALIELQQGQETADLLISILQSQTNLYFSLISNGMNRVMKVLTVMMAILSVPTLVFSFFGMNIGLPLQQTESAWLGTILASLMFSVALVIIITSNNNLNK